MLNLPVSLWKQILGSRADAGAGRAGINSHLPLHRRTGKPSAACAGARKVALKAIAGMGVITAPTESAWQAECDRRGIRNGVIFKT